MLNALCKDYVESVFESADIKTNGERPWDIKVYNEDFYTRLVLMGSLGLGESYVDSWWDSSQLDESR